jgi:hypothetical protein
LGWTGSKERFILLSDDDRRQKRCETSKRLSNEASQ